MQLITVLLEDALAKAMQHYGIEGTEEAINRVYKHMPTVRRALLTLLNRKLKRSLGNEKRKP
jgi:hypothetical protein